MPELTDEQLESELKRALEYRAGSLKVAETAQRVARARARATQSPWRTGRTIVSLVAAVAVAFAIGSAYSVWRGQGGSLPAAAAPGASCGNAPTGSPSHQESTPDRSPSVGQFKPTGAMTSPRQEHTATLLISGLVLITGGYDNGLGLASAELYNPVAGTFSATGSMANSRYLHTATLLCDGRVLVVGGQGGLATAELYAPTTGTFNGTGSMAHSRVGQTATRLSDGRVLLAGGSSDTSAELYDPALGTFEPTGSMQADREFASATLLADGKVLICGGQAPGPMLGTALSSCERYDLATGTFSSTGSMSVARVGATATLLHDGRVLVAGDREGSKSAELYSPATGTFETTGSMAAVRQFAASAILPDGRVFVVGGSSSSVDEVYDPIAGSFSPTGAMTARRMWPTATIIQDGSVLIAGGLGGPDSAQSSSTLSSADSYTE